MKTTTRVLATTATLVLLGAGATACGSHNDYAPVAYGENGHCYYVDDPHEVDALYAQGRCPHNWTPVLMPLFWHQRYYSYYSSPAYYNVFVPASSRTVFVTHQQSFGTQYRSQIAQETSKATYRNSKGKTVPGNKVSTTKFGSGSRSGSSGSTGSRSCFFGLGESGEIQLNNVSYETGTSGGSRGGSSSSSRSSSSRSTSSTPSRPNTNSPSRPGTSRC